MPEEADRAGVDWTDGEIIVAVYLYRFGWEDLGVTYPDLGKIMKRKPSTIMHRFSNFLSLEGISTGFKNGGRRAEEIYHEYKATPKDLLRRKALECLFELARTT